MGNFSKVRRGDRVLVVQRLNIIQCKREVDDLSRASSIHRNKSIESLDSIAVKSQFRLEQSRVRVVQAKQPPSLEVDS